MLHEASTLSNGNREKHLSLPAAGTALDVLQLSGSYKKIEQKSMAYILQKETKRNQYPEIVLKYKNGTGSN